MLAVNYSTIRDNLKNYCDKATDEAETVIVTRKNEKNVRKTKVRVNSKDKVRVHSKDMVKVRVMFNFMN